MGDKEPKASEDEPAETLRAEGVHFVNRERTALRLESGRIVEISAERAGHQESTPLIGPGLVDLQINGCYGMDFNSVPLAEAVVERVTRALWAEGVTTYLPTIVTNSDDAIESAMHAIAGARSGNRLVERSVAGIHLEGPFISPEDGPRGAHARSYVKSPDWSLFQRWQEVAEGSIRLITLSPEWPGSTNFIVRCVESGVKVGIGHTAASPAQIRDAVSAGARMSTHLGNGAHPWLPRHPNYIWEQLANDSLSATLIADGFHLPDSVLRVACRAKGHRAMLVSDAVSFCGMEPGEYETHVGGRVVLTQEGRLHLAENPALLAGSARTLREGVEHLVNRGLCSLGEAWEMASVRPARFMGLPQEGGLAEGAPADLVVFGCDGIGLRVLQTFKDGHLVYDERNAGKTDVRVEELD